MISRALTLLATFGAAALALPNTERASPSYIWNATESVPIGLYRLQPVERLTVTDLVAIRPPEPLASFLDLNGYLPLGLPLLKRVLALPGQTVCRIELTVVVDNIEMGQARERDGRGRPLPIWQGCRVLAADEIFVMNWQSADSLDGRYFRDHSRICRHRASAPHVDQGGVSMLDLLRCAFPDRSHHHAAVPADFVVIAPLVVGARPDAAIFRRQQEWRLASENSG